MDSDNALLEFIGLKSLDQLFYDVPDKIRIKNNSLKSGMSEMELLINSSDIGSRNNSNMSIFLGSGSYNRYIPSAVQNIIMRNEFITAYTPFLQPRPLQWGHHTWTSLSHPFQPDLK